MESFTREELQTIRKKAVENANEVKNSYWKNAYIEFAYAADKLDAMEARTEDK